MPDSEIKQPEISDDWTKNWQASIAVKITAVVMWVIIPFGFILALLFINNLQGKLQTSVVDDADMLVNSARTLLSDNNSYNSTRTRKQLLDTLKKSVYCKISLSKEQALPIVMYANGCTRKTETVDKKYYFSTLFNDQFQELTLVLSHQPVESIITKQRSNVIVIMIIIVIVLGLVLTWVIRLLVLKPLLNMVDVTRKISEGKHELRLAINQHDEFGFLAKFFDKMLDQVFEQQKNLKHANLELMKEVAERNRIALELRASRDQLEQLVAERTADLAVARDEALEANKAKSFFLANMSHEIRTPLNALLGYAQLLHRDSDVTEKQLKSLRIIEESGNHLLELLNDILDISNIETGKMKLNSINFNLNELLQSLSQVFSERCSDKGLLWHEKFELGKNIQVHSDPQKLRQILINLIGNAIKFTEQGDITLTVRLSGNDTYLFKVQDTGSGIADDQIKSISKMFHLKEVDDDKKGAGLGLAITEKLLYLLDSQLNISSKTDEGSVFSFEVKLKPAHSGFEIRQESSMELVRLSSSDSVRALVVDDSELSRNLLVDMLLEINAQVDSAVNGLEAVNKIEASGADEIPDIVFMDIRMPVMNGIDAAQQIKNRYGDNIVCVAVTATMIEDSGEKLFQLGFDDFIAKPYRFESVFECMKNHLNINFEQNNSLQPEQTELFKIDFQQCHIDADMFDELINASRNYAVGDLKSLLAKLTEYGQEEQKVAQKLSIMMEHYNMQGMINLIEQLKNNKSENE